MRIRSGSGWVVDSGVVTTFGGASLELVLELPDDNLMVELCFDSDDSGAPAVRSTETGNGWRLQCTNFDDERGRGSAEPVLLGEIGADLIFLHFRVFRYGASVDRTIHFTFFRARKERVGWTTREGGPREDGSGSTG